ASPRSNVFSAASRGGFLGLEATRSAYALGANVPFSGVCGNRSRAPASRPLPRSWTEAVALLPPAAMGVDGSRQADRRRAPIFEGRTRSGTRDQTAPGLPRRRRG